MADESKRQGTNTIRPRKHFILRWSNEEIAMATPKARKADLENVEMKATPKRDKANTSPKLLGDHFFSWIHRWNARGIPTRKKLARSFGEPKELFIRMSRPGISTE